MNATLPYKQTEAEIANFLARIAVRALYFEVKAYPKPGLVSFVDSGAHQDMNGATFYRSILSLRHYFSQIIREGLRRHDFAALKQLAIQAEQRMLEKTAGINTHRGAIFALGLLSISTARLMNAQSIFTARELQQQLLADWRADLAEHQTNPRSHGAVVRKNLKIVDARQMAMQGYELPFQLLAPFIELFLETSSIDTVCLFAYLELLQGIDDTNILYRKGEQGLAYAKSRAAELLALNCHQARMTQAIDMHHLFSRENISPGGVADLLAIVLFLGQVFCEQLRCHY
ncbi:triphosphoribosyl-dephospho-CoA synthase [Legionella massiliensis]|nr:triphosphoribosyl-dephospho-CoA synthase [Legionella massiliensis]